MKVKTLSSRILISLISITTFLLTACGPSPDSKGQIEKTVDGHTVVLTWETKNGDFGKCQILIVENATSSLNITWLPEGCTAELVAGHLEEVRSSKPLSAPNWEFEILDQFIAELKQSE